MRRGNFRVVGAVFLLYESGFCAMIEAVDLKKCFGPKPAVDGVSFTVARGGVLGFLGPNGAGKSTTMRMLTGFLPPSAGRVLVGGRDLAEDPAAAKRQSGYLPESAPVYPDMTVAGFLRFCAEARGLWGRRRDAAVDRVVETCFLGEVRRQPVDTLSKGYRHRTCFAQSLLHDPPALVLDEPTDGLDPNQKHEIRGLIRRMGGEKAIILSTHILEEVDAVCSRVIIIDRGRLVADGTPAELRSRAASAGLLTVRLEGSKAPEAASWLAALPGAERVEAVAESATAAEFRIAPAKGASARLPGDVAHAAAAHGLRCEELHVEEGRLDEFFRSVTQPDTAAPRAKEGVAE